jgi:fumarate reductase subunit C
MSSDARYTVYHPKWYRRPVSVWWWLKKASYTRFVARELTSLAVAYFALLMLWHAWAVGRGPEAYARFAEWMATPLFVVSNVLALGGVLFHALTWFHLAPKAMAVRLRGRRVPDWAVTGGNYLAWVVASAVVAYVVLGAGR